MTESAPPAALPPEESLPVSYGEISQLFTSNPNLVPFDLRKRTIERIERTLGRPLIVYATKTSRVVPGSTVSIDNDDITGFTDLVEKVPGDAVDVFLVSNGGAAEATERIVRLLRTRFKSVRFVVVRNAFSAATLMCFAGDAILMDASGTLGPIDPQINGIPARAILRGFEAVEQRLKKEGPGALTAYMPLISKYDLHVFEICKTADELSKELAGTWLADYMFKCPPGDPRIAKIVEFFSNYDVHKSHGRSIDREAAAKLGLKIMKVEEVGNARAPLLSLYNQLEFFFDRSPFYKLYEDVRGTNWGRQNKEVRLPIALPGIVPPQKG